MALLGNPYLFAQNPPSINGGYWDPGFYNTNGVFYPGGRAPAQISCLLLDGDNNLYVGGGFKFAGSVAADDIARWDGTNWSPLGSGFRDVRAMAWDEASKTLYAASSLPTSNNVAKWDGLSWSPIPGLANAYIFAMAWDGANLYVGGTFNFSDEPFIDYHVAKWDGLIWSPVGTGLNGLVRALAWDGANLYAGGDFNQAGGVSAYGGAKWDGSSWSPIGSSEAGYLRYLSAVYSLAWDDASKNLYVGGSFNTAGEVSVSNIVKWDGANWSSLGSGFDNMVFSLALDKSSGSLYAGGGFSSSGGVPLNRIAKWDGATWSPLGSGVQEWATTAFNSVNTLFWDNASNSLYAGGQFPMVGGVPANGIARWDGSQWYSLGNEAHTVNAPVRALAWEKGTNRIYVGGSFSVVGWIPARNIARLEGTNWSPLGSGMTGTHPQLSSVTALAWDGTNNHLYAGGLFIKAGESPANNIARWDGANWFPLGSGVNGEVLALAWDSDTNNLYVGGSFAMAGGNQANHIARWDGADWFPLGAGMDGEVLALVWDNVSKNLYAGGNFKTAGEVTANYIAKWDGITWSPLGSGMMNGWVMALAWDHSKSHLYAGGNFTGVDGNIIRQVAKWDGNGWMPLGEVVGNQLGPIHALAWDGATNSLYAGGSIHQAGGVPANMVAKWDGTNWSPLGSGLLWDSVLTLAWDDVNNSLYAGGYFMTAGGNPSYYLARWVPSYRLFLPLIFKNP